MYCRILFWNFFCAWAPLALRLRDLDRELLFDFDLDFDFDYELLTDLYFFLPLEAFSLIWTLLASREFPAERKAPSEFLLTKPWFLS